MDGRPISRGQAARGRRFAVLAVVGSTVLVLAGTLYLGIWFSDPATGMPQDKPASATRGGARVLAVLPFTPDAPDPNTAFFGVGLADAIITRLAGIPGLRVLPMSATLSSRQEGGDPVEIGRRLGAGAVMLGSYEREGGGLRVTIKLLDLGTGATLLDHHLESSLTDLMQVEQIVAEETLGALLPSTIEGERRWEGGAETQVASAHYLYTLARGKIATLESGSIRETVTLLEDAVAADPGFARAHAALAEASANVSLGGFSPDSSWTDRAIAAGRRAVFLDDMDPECHYALSYAMAAAGDPVGATRESLRALQLDPDHPAALRQIALHMSAAGAGAAAVKLRDRAREADPSIELGWVDLYIALSEGWTSQLVSLLEQDALDRRGRGRSPEQPIMHLGLLAFTTGDAAAGLRWAAALEEVSSNVPFTDLVRMLAHARTGNAEAVTRIIEKNRDIYLRDWDYSELVAQALALVGHHEDALQWLRRSVDRGCFASQVLANSDALDGLRTDPRFLEAITTVRQRAGEIVQMARFAGYR